MADKLSSPIGDKTIDPSNAKKNDQLMQPNAKDDPETLTADNPQKAWFGKGGKPKPPFGQQGRNF